MGIWFNNEKARKFLLEHGCIYTLRPYLRRQGSKKLYWNKKEDKGIVNVVLVKNIEENSDNLILYLRESGFETIKEWLEEANNSKYLYFVRLIKLYGDNNGN